MPQPSVIPQQLLYSRMKGKNYHSVPAGGNPPELQDGMQMHGMFGSVFAIFRLPDAQTAQSRHEELFVHCHGHEHLTNSATADCMAASACSRIGERRKI